MKYIKDQTIEKQISRKPLCEEDSIDDVYHVIKFDIQKAEDIEIIGNVYSDHEESR